MYSEFHSALVGIYVTCSILIIGTNLLLIGLILASRELRRTNRNVLVVGVCTADLLMGCFVTPMFTRRLLHGAHPDCHTHMAVQIIADHGVFFVVGWTLVILNALHIAQYRSQRKSLSTPFTNNPRQTNASGRTSTRQYTPLPSNQQGVSETEEAIRSEDTTTGDHTHARQQRLDPNKKKNSLTSFWQRIVPDWAQPWVLASLPWVASAFTIVPMLLSNASMLPVYHFDGERLVESSLCMLSLPWSVLVATVFFSLYLPFYLCTAALFTEIFLCWRDRNILQNQTHHVSQSHVYRNEQNRLTTQSTEQDQADANTCNASCDRDTIVDDTTCSNTSSIANDHSSNSVPSDPKSSLTLVQNSSNLDTASDQVESPLVGLSGETGRILSTPQDSTSPTMAYTPNNLTKPLTLMMPNVTYLLCYAPLLVHTWFHLSGVGTPQRVYGIVLFSLLGRSFLMPFSWFVFRELRTEALENWSIIKTFLQSSRTKRFRGSTSSASTISFNRLREAQVV